MIPEHKEIIKNSTKDIFSLQEKFSDFELNSNFQLLISQLDLFKLLASLVVAIISIGYLYDSKLDSTFLLLSLICSLSTLIISISYTREVIDLQPKLNTSTYLEITKKIQEHNDIALKAIKDDDSKIYFDYAREESKKPYPKPQMNQMGEIIIFFFYLSIGFLGLSLISYNSPIKFLSYATLLLLIVVYLISFKSWAIWFSEKLSTPLNKAFRRRSR